MCNGSIMDKLISFALPLMLSGVLQLMFNAVDIIVVGRFSGSQALAAVGSTTALIAVFTNLFIGISLGANVLGARFYAAGRDKEMSETVHTAITLALISGIAMAFIGVLFARGALELMGTPDDVIRLSTLYMRIYFCGMPFFMLYNYGAAILRAVGDTKRPLIFLLISGSTNAVLNLVLVIKFDLGVAGVGIATVISQMISCVLVLRCLHKSDSSYQLRFSKLKIKKAYMMQIFQVGIPAGIQSTGCCVTALFCPSAYRWHWALVCMFLARKSCRFILRILRLSSVRWKSFCIPQLLIFYVVLWICFREHCVEWDIQQYR